MIWSFRPVRAAVALLAAALATACTSVVVGRPTAAGPAVSSVPTGTASPSPTGPACAGDRYSPARLTLPATSPQHLPLTSADPVTQVVLVAQYQRSGGSDALQELTRDGFAGGRSRLWQTGQIGTRTWRLDTVAFYTFYDGPAACHFLGWLTRLHHLRTITVPGVPGAVGTIGSATAFSASELVASTGRFVVTSGSIRHGSVAGLGEALLRGTYTQR